VMRLCGRGRSIPASVFVRRWGAGRLGAGNAMSPARCMRRRATLQLMVLSFPCALIQPNSWQTRRARCSRQSVVCAGLEIGREIFTRIDLVQEQGLEEAHEHGHELSAPLCPAAVEVLAGDGGRTHGAFGPVVVHGDLRMVHKEREPVPVRFEALEDLAAGEAKILAFEFLAPSGGHFFMPAKPRFPSAAGHFRKATTSHRPEKSFPALAPACRNFLPVVARWAAFS